ncbi:unnamed protein product [Phaeothamnion confervicola]
MDQTVAELNIEHFRKLLLTSLDDEKRAMVKKLLAAEEAKLATILRQRK